MESRKRKLFLNTTSSLTLQITTIICGFILPKLMLKFYGSKVNGLVSSINQFLTVIAFLELGVGAVVRSSLYEPLSKNDKVQISKIMVSAGKFFNTIGKILLAYTIFLIFFYPVFVKSKFSFTYTATLIGAMSISYFSQYFFGLVDGLLLTADQRGYIQYNIQTITIIANTIACAILISLEAPIQLVRLTTSIIYLARPIYLRRYINKHYEIDRKITYTEEPIKQKRNGVAQHLASIVLDGTDTMVLTVLSTLESVSIYVIHNLVVKGIKQLFMSTITGAQALLGELRARQELDTLYNFFEKVERSVHMGVVFIFGSTLFLLTPFVTLYTHGVNDANYYQPLFAVVLVLANGLHCLRLPYNTMILAAGKYKETQNNYIISASLNLIISILSVKRYGLVGVAIGTLIAMLYQTVRMANYDSKNLIPGIFKRFLLLFFTDALIILIAIPFVKLWGVTGKSLEAWIISALKVVCILLVIMTIVNFIFYKKNTKRLLGKLKKKFIKK